MVDFSCFGDKFSIFGNWYFEKESNNTGVNIKGQGSFLLYVLQVILLKIEEYLENKIQTTLWNNQNAVME